MTNNTVHDNNNLGIVFIGYESTCPEVALDRARNGVCRGNTVWNITSQGNQAYPDGDYSAGGIYVDGGAAIVVERNVVHDCDIGAELASEHTGRFTAGITLRDNFLFRNREAGLLLGGYAPQGTGGIGRCRIVGNSFFDNDTRQEGNGEIQLRSRTLSCVLLDNLVCSGAQGLCITAPVSAAQTPGTILDYNLYFSAAGVGGCQWSWNMKALTGLPAWKRATHSDAHSFFADPLFSATGAVPDLHLQSRSPAVNAGSPYYHAASGETDIDGQPRVSNARVDIGADELSGGN